MVMEYTHDGYYDMLLTLDVSNICACTVALEYSLLYSGQRLPYTNVSGRRE
jgi:hypothetical protein